jgi:hypothetical protein
MRPPGSQRGQTNSPTTFGETKLRTVTPAHARTNQYSYRFRAFQKPAASLFMADPKRRPLDSLTDLPCAILGGHSSHTVVSATTRDFNGHRAGRRVRWKHAEDRTESEVAHYL